MTPFHHQGCNLCKISEKIMLRCKNYLKYNTYFIFLDKIMSPMFNLSFHYLLRIKSSCIILLIPFVVFSEKVLFMLEKPKIF